MSRLNIAILVLRPDTAWLEIRPIQKMQELGYNINVINRSRRDVSGSIGINTIKVESSQRC